jgi:hypothetical protein
MDNVVGINGRPVEVGEEAVEFDVVKALAETAAVLHGGEFGEVKSVIVAAHTEQGVELFCSGELNGPAEILAMLDVVRDGIKDAYLEQLFGGE